MTRKTGYHLWVYGECTWHRSLEVAERKANKAQQWASDVQIVDVRTGDRVVGDPQDTDTRQAERAIQAQAITA